MSETGRDLAELLTKLCLRFDQLVRSAQIYPDDHPALDGSLTAVQSMVAEALAGGGERRFGPTGSRFLVDGVGIPMSRATSRAMEGVREWLSTRGIGGYCLSAEMEFPEILKAVRVLDGAPEHGLVGTEALNEALAGAGVIGLSVTELRSAESTDAPGLGPLRLYLQGVRAVQRLHGRGLSPALLVELRTLCSDLRQLVQQDPGQAWSLTEPREMLPLSLRHPVHNAVVSLMLSDQMRLEDSVAEAVALATLCADVGKRGLDEDDRGLPARLSPEARARHARHPALAVGELLRLPVMDPALRRWMLVAFEQERGEGNGAGARSGAPVDRHPVSRLLGLAAAWDRHRVAAGPGVAAEALLPSFRAAETGRHPEVLMSHLEFLVERHAES